MIKLHNTLTDRREELKTIVSSEVRIYCCGPTVYDHAHIGNLSAYLFTDLLKRYLRYRGFEVKDVMNLTDVDDKTINASRDQGTSLEEYTQFYTDVFLRDLAKLNMMRPGVLCKATDHITEMIELVQLLLDKGYAYQSSDGSVYFSISALESYGALSGVELDDLRTNAGCRLNTDEYEKEEAADFVLWKARSPEDGEVYWPAPFGEGRPGWHIECSAMSMKYLGDAFDIHAGGCDLVFPHHENEIAQSRAATGELLANYWFHNGHLTVDGRKMSKSAGNFYTLRDIEQELDDLSAFRYLILSHHYRSGVNFTWSSLQAAVNSLQRLRNFIGRLEEAVKTGSDNNGLTTEVDEGLVRARQRFQQAMDDDLDTPSALASLWELVREMNTLIDEGRFNATDAEATLKLLAEQDRVWGCLFYQDEKRGLSKEQKEEIEDLIRQRAQMRHEKRWQEADQLRERLEEKGVMIKDRGSETVWQIGGKSFVYSQQQDLDS